MLRTPRYKYVSYANAPIEKLYDMQKDPGETRNLAQSSGAAWKRSTGSYFGEWEARLDLAPENPNGEWWRKL